MGGRGLPPYSAALRAVAARQPKKDVQPGDGERAREKRRPYPIPWLQPLWGEGEARKRLTRGEDAGGEPEFTRAPARGETRACRAPLSSAAIHLPQSICPNPSAAIHLLQSNNAVAERDQRPLGRYLESDRLRALVKAPAV